MHVTETPRMKEEKQIEEYGNQRERNMGSKK